MTTTDTTTETFRYLDGYATILVGRESGGASVIELAMPADSGSPAHAHDEDETVVVLDGDVTFLVGDQVAEPDEHGTITLPRGVAHSYRVGAREARWLSITSGRYERFVRAVAQPADAPAATELDLGRAVAVTVAAAEAGIEIVGPAPAAPALPPAASLRHRVDASPSLPSALARVAA
jgi:quercetin dioxygenase-like cupin family protein